MCESGKKRAHFGHSTVGNTTYNAQRQYRQTMNSTEVTYSDIKNAQKAYEDQKIALTMFQNMKRRFYAGRRRGQSTRRPLGCRLLNGSAQLYAGSRRQ